MKTPALRFSAVWKFENNDIITIMWYSCLRFPQAQLWNDRWLFSLPPQPFLESSRNAPPWLLRFQISPESERGQKAFDGFST